LYWRRKFWEDPDGKYRMCRERIKAYKNITFPV